MNIRLTALAVTLALLAAPTLAETAHQMTFPSAEAAGQALFAAVKNHDDAAIGQILGATRTAAERRDEEQLEHEQFARKYAEMHRLAKDHKGQRVLYIGAENWPFPIPLVEQNDVWRFDFGAGEQEILFRRIGENEMTAIEVCRALAQSVQDPTAHQDDELLATLLADGERGGTPTPYRGYRFRVLNRHGPDLTVIAYPSAYRSSGVMTFVTGQNAAVYAKDLGANTTKLAQRIKTYGPDKSWRAEPMPGSP
jgi:hypothetical protein